MLYPKSCCPYATSVQLCRFRSVAKSAVQLTRLGLLLKPTHAISVSTHVARRSVRRADSLVAMVFRTRPHVCDPSEGRPLAVLHLYGGGPLHPYRTDGCDVTAFIAGTLGHDLRDRNVGVSGRDRSLDRPLAETDGGLSNRDADRNPASECLFCFHACGFWRTCCWSALLISASAVSDLRHLVDVPCH